MTTLEYKKYFNEVHEFSSVIGTEARSNKYEGIATTQFGYMPERGDKFAFIDPTVYLFYKKNVHKLILTYCDR